MKRLFYFFVCTLLFIACGGGGDGGGGDSPSGGSEYLNVQNVDISGDNTTATLNIQASNNCEWTITWSDEWIRSISPSKGRGQGNVTIMVDINPSPTKSRQANLTVSNANKSITRYVTLTQAPNNEQLSVSPTSLTFTADGGEQEISVTSNTTWTVKGKADWFVIDKESGSGNGTVKVTSKANTDFNEKDAVLTFTGNKIVTEVKIHQAAYKVDFYVTTPTSMTAGALAETLSIGVAGNTNWIVQSDQEWAVPNVTSGQGEKTISVSLSANKEQQSRTAKITIVPTGKESVEVTITQDAATMPEVSVLTLLEAERNEAKLSFSVTSVFPITDSGLCYSVSNTVPTISDTCQKVTDNTSTVVLTELESGSTYYVRAYATSEIGTTYSRNVVIIKTTGSDPSEDDNPFPNPK